MSLINEALKRVETERRRNGAPPPVNAWPAAGQQNLEPTAPRRKHLGGAIALVVCVGAALIGVTYFTSPTDHSAPTPDAAQQPATPAAQPKPAPPANQPPSEPSSPAGLAQATAAAAGAAEPKDKPPRPPVAISIPPATPKPAAPTPAPAARRPPSPPLLPQDFKLGGIMQSDGAGHAIINNHLLGVGDEIEGARIVEIGRYHVVIERGDNRLTLRM